MTDIDRLDQRLSAVERVVVDGDVTLEELSELTSLDETVAELEERIEEQERRIADLEASVQSIEGYVGSVESINDDVERQAASAVATVDRIERRLDKLEVEINDLEGGLLENNMDHNLRDEQSAATKTNTAGQNTDTVNTNQPVTGNDSATADTTDDDAENDVFQFSNGRSTPEESVGELIEETTQSDPIIDDGVDRELSSANQSAVEAAVNPNTDTSTTDADDDEDNGTGLISSLRSRLS